MNYRKNDINITIYIINSNMEGVSQTDIDNIIDFEPEPEPDFAPEIESESESESESEIDFEDEAKVKIKAKDEVKAKVLNECEICTEKYTPKLRKKITCTCNYSACKQCVQTYLLSNKKPPQCMMCNKAWDIRFVSDNLNKTFLKGDLKTHNNSLIIEIEKSKLPETMQFVGEYIIKLNFEKQLRKLETERVQKIEHINMEMNKAIGLLKKPMNMKKDIERKQFMMKCPNEIDEKQCRGFLSSQYKCDICEIKVCSQCFEIKGHIHVDHECKPENVASAEAIKKETKSCPKCATRIFKISGCDQMWCTQCQIAFSWKTGKIENGNIHNPHFYNWKKDQKQQVRNPGDIVCGGLIDLGMIIRKLRVEHIVKFAKDDTSKLNGSGMTKIITDIHRGIGDYRWTLANFRATLQNNVDSRQLRIQYLANEITEAQFYSKITKKYNAVEKIRPILDILELYNTIATENLNNIQADNSIGNILKIIDTLLELRDYVNKEFIEVNKSYSGIPYQITQFFLLRKIR